VNFIDILKGKKVASSQELGHIIVELEEKQKILQTQLDLLEADLKQLGNGLDAEIAQLIPPRYQVQNHQKPTKDEMVNSINMIEILRS